MRTASYPCDNLLEIEADTSRGQQPKEKMFDIPDDPDDGVVRVMKLPMIDNVNDERGPVLDVQGSWEVSSNTIPSCGEKAKYLMRGFLCGGR